MSGIHTVLVDAQHLYLNCNFPGQFFEIKTFFFFLLIVKTRCLHLAEEIKHRTTTSPACVSLPFCFLFIFFPIGASENEIFRRHIRRPEVCKVRRR